MINSITIGPFSFHLYGFIIATAIAIGYIFINKTVNQKSNINPSQFDRLARYTIFYGIIGARIYHVIDAWAYYQSHLIQIIYLWQGGLGIYGAIIGGIIGLTYSARQLPQFYYLIDTTVIYLPLCQAIGRLGNYVNQELYGQPTSLPWGIYIDPLHRLPQVSNFATFHPLFLYELLLNLALFLLLYFYHLKKSYILGTLIPFSFYLIGYGLIRFFLEPFRINPWQIGQLNVAQILSLILIFTGIMLLCFRCYPKTGANSAS